MVGREYNMEPNKISKIIDFDDRYTTQNLTNILEQLGGKISIDRFVSDINKKNLKGLIEDIYVLKQKA